MERTSKIFQWLLVGLFVLSAFLFMFRLAVQDSATMDELAHIPAGYGYVKYLDYRLNHEHPPLVKAIAAFPLLFQKFNFPTESSAWQTDVNGQWEMGTKFIYQSNNDADKIIVLSRIGPIILTLILIVFIYIFSQELLGGWWALLPTFLFAFSPTVLAHGHYVTTDIGAALGIFIALYYFLKFLFKPNIKYVLLAGLTLGIASLMKFSTVLLIPIFIFLLIIFLIWKIRKEKISIFDYLFKTLFIFIISCVLIYIFYFIFTFNYPPGKQLTDSQFLLNSFAGGPDPAFKSCQFKSNIPLPNRIRCLAEIDILMTQNKILRPLAQYLLGVLTNLQRSSFGHTDYFMGEVSAGGWRYYFPTVFAFKEPLPSLIFIALALLIAIISIIKNIKNSGIKQSFLNYLGTDFELFSILTFVIFYWAYSIKSPLNIGFRHLLPTLPFIYILSIDVIKKWWIIGKPSGNIMKIVFGSLKKLLISSLKTILITGLVIWFLLETVLSYPYFLSYFNQIGGGIWNGYKYVVDSNYDWGQDLKRFKDFVENPPAGEKINKIAIDYFGGGNPKYYLGNKAEYWWSAKGNPKEEGINYLALSIHTIQIASGKTHPGLIRNPEDEYLWLKNIRDIYKPDFKAGTSIFIYKL